MRLVRGPRRPRRAQVNACGKIPPLLRRRLPLNLRDWDPHQHPPEGARSFHQPLRMPPATSASALRKRDLGTRSARPLRVGVGPPPREYPRFRSPRGTLFPRTHTLPPPLGSAFLRRPGFKRSGKTGSHTRFFALAIVMGISTEIKRWETFF